jgi:hypothetical protein
MNIIQLMKRIRTKLNGNSMKLKNYFIFLFIFLTVFAPAQSKSLIIPVNVTLPKDTIVGNNLIKSLNGFLSLKENENKDNTYVLNEDLLETSVLLDEMKGIEKSGKYKDDNFYKGYLSNVVELDKTNFLIQFSYIGVNENIPILVASFEILAHQKENKFYFLSPLKRNTSSWKTKKIENCIFHFKNVLNTKTANEYVKAVALFDKKLKSTNKQIEWYGCNDLPELLNSIGVKYKLEYNGRSSSTFNAKENNTLLLVSGEGSTTFDSFDPHDLWHERLHNVYSRNSINKPIDEGCAYLYGGSWGISWQEILKKFKEKIASNTNTNWLDIYNGKQVNFGESQEKHLMADYVINALLVQKIEKERSFSGVLDFLLCGKFEKENENYFKALEKATGVNKANFNDNVWALIKESK